MGGWGGGGVKFFLPFGARLTSQILLFGNLDFMPFSMVLTILAQFFYQYFHRPLSRSFFLSSVSSSLSLLCLVKGKMSSSCDLLVRSKE